MSIKREDIDQRKVDCSDVRSGRRLPTVHPGAILRDEFLIPMGTSVYELANAIKVPRSRTTTSCAGAAPSRRIPPFALDGTSARPLISGSTCRPALILM